MQNGADSAVHQISASTTHSTVCSEAKRLCISWSVLYCTFIKDERKVYCTVLHSSSRLKIILQYKQFVQVSCQLFHKSPIVYGPYWVMFLKLYFSSPMKYCIVSCVRNMITHVSSLMYHHLWYISDEIWVMYFLGWSGHHTYSNYHTVQILS